MIRSSLGTLFLIEVKAILVFVVTEEFRFTSPIYNHREHPVGLFARQEHREMFEHHLLAQRAILLRAEQTDKITEQSELLQLFAQQELALVDVALQKLLTERLHDDVARGRRNETENLASLHYLEQVAELELQVARDLIAVFAPTLIVQIFEQAENPGQ